VTGEIVFWALAVMAALGAAMVVFTRDMTRLVLALGVFLLAIAGLFLYYGMAFLAAAQVFVYVGGVLVVVLFAITALKRDATGRPTLSSRHDLSAFVIAVGLFILLVITVGPSAPAIDQVYVGPDKTADLADTLLGPMLPHFEVLGVTLLVALVAVLAVIGGRERE
jgi:NADH-quinone oxidoreductase subunit J